MRILIGTDGSACSFKAVREFIKFARHGNFDIIVLHVIPFISLGIDATYLKSRMEKDGAEALYATKEILSEMDSAIVHTELREGSPAATILHVAQERDIDLIVLGHCGKGESYLGSVTRAVMEKSPCSILAAK